MLRNNYDALFQEGAENLEEESIMEGLERELRAGMEARDMLIVQDDRNLNGMAEMLLMPDVWLRAMDGVAGNALVVGEEFVNDEGHEDYRRVLTDKGRRNISFMTWLLAEPGLGCLLDYVKEKSEGADSYPEKIRPAISVFADNVKRGYNAFNLSSLAMGKKERAREEKWVEGSSNLGLLGDIVGRALAIKERTGDYLEHVVSAQVFADRNGITTGQLKDRYGFGPNLGEVK